MNNKTKARFFGMHIGCEVQFIDKDVQALAGLDISLAQPICMLGNGGKCTIGGAKLILRPLSDITDEEAVEAARLYGLEFSINDLIRFDDYLLIKASVYSVFIWLRPDDDSIVSVEVSGEVCSFRQFEIIDWLRSRNFCLPFMGLDPVKEGWAILQPKTEKIEQ